MAITEENRHHRYVRLEEVLGRAHATTMMEHLPPVGWADVATKRDLDALEARIGHRFELVDRRFEAIDDRFATMEARFDAKLERALRAQFRNLMAGNAALLTAFVALDLLVD